MIRPVDTLCTRRPPDVWPDPPAVKGRLGGRWSSALRARYTKHRAGQQPRL